MTQRNSSLIHESAFYVSNIYISPLVLLHTFQKKNQTLYPCCQKLCQTPKHNIVVEPGFQVPTFFMPSQSFGQLSILGSWFRPAKHHISLVLPHTSRADYKDLISSLPSHVSSQSLVLPPNRFQLWFSYVHVMVELNMCGEEC